MPAATSSPPASPWSPTGAPSSHYSDFLINSRGCPACTIHAPERFLLVGCCFISRRIPRLYFWRKAPWQQVLHQVLLGMKLSIGACPAAARCLGAEVLEQIFCSVQTWMRACSLPWGLAHRLLRAAPPTLWSFPSYRFISIVLSPLRSLRAFLNAAPRPSVSEV